MAKTLIEIDEALMAAAATELGTTTKTDTVNEALKFVAGRRQRAQALFEGTSRAARSTELTSTPPDSAPTASATPSTKRH